MTSNDPERAPTHFHALLDRACARLESDEHGKARAELHLPDAWAQGRASFGGLLAGLALELGERLVAAQGSDRAGSPARRARSMQVLFVKPIVGAARYELERLRHGRSATSMRATLRDAEGEIAMSASACFAAPRESIVEIPGPPAPSLPAPESLPSMPYFEGVTPRFVRKVEMRFASPGFPGANNPSRRGGSFTGYVRLREADRPASSAVIAALVDAWPSPVLQNFDRFVPASSLSWNLELVEPAPADARGEDWWIYAVETDRASGGWVHSRAQLWSRCGTLVATSTQTVAVYG